MKTVVEAITALLEDRTVTHSVNPHAVDAYFTLKYIPSPYSIYSDINKLTPGHILIVAANKSYTQKSFWFVDPGSFRQRRRRR